MRLASAFLVWLASGPIATGAQEGSMRKPDMEGEVSRSCLTAEHGVGGYDLVAYQSGTARPGDSELWVEHQGTRYLFASEANRQAFAAEPARYLPRYGGWCAMSLALGSFTCPDYENFQLEDGHLLLFETTVFTNGRTLWNRDPAENREKADRNYRDLEP